MAPHEALDDGLVIRAERLEVHALRVHALGEVAVLVEDVGQAAAHPGSEVAARAAEDDYRAPRHVLAAVVADTLDHGLGAAVAHREALARGALEVGLAGGGAVERDVAGDDVLGRVEGRAARYRDDDLRAGEALAAVVIGVALDPQRDPARAEGAEALARRAAEAQVDRVLGQTPRPAPARNLGAEDRADGAVGVPDRELDAHALAALDRGARELHHLHVEHAVEEAPVLRSAVAAGVRDVGPVQQRREVEALRLPVLDRAIHLEPVGAADHLVDRPEAEARHLAAHLPRP